MSSPEQNSKGQILKSSAVIGSSSAITMLMGLVRGKAIALMLGPSGDGLWAIGWSLTELTRNIAGMGLNASGVRQIAESVGSGDQKRIARTVITLRRVSLVLGLIGALGLAALCIPVGRIWFNDDNHAGPVALLSISVLLAVVSQGQSALIQGMRRIGDLAKINIAGAVMGTVLCIPVVYFYHERGIYPALVGAAAMTLLASWWFARKIHVEPVAMTTRDVTAEASGLVRLGFLFMVSGLMTVGVSNLVIIVLSQTMDKYSVGLYQAAWLLGGYFVGFIVQAMGADFYPRLTAAAKDNAECNRLVNEQTEVGLLLAGPGLLGTIVFAPLAIQIAKSSAFLPAVELLRWISLGMLLRVIAWPMGFVMLAKNAQRIFFVSELASNLIYLGLVWCLVQWLKLNGVGIAFALFYALYAGGVYFIARRLSGFRWNRETLGIALVYTTLAFGVLLAFHYLITPVAYGFGTAALIGTGIYSTRKLCQLVPAERFPRPARRILVQLRLLPASANL